jgi:hypothetical protein
MILGSAVLSLLLCSICQLSQGVKRPVSEFLKPYGLRCGVEKGTQMGGLLGRKGGCSTQCCQSAEILQNNSKPAVEKIWLQRKISGRTAAVFGEKRPKTGQKNFFCEKLVLKGVLLLSVSLSQRIFTLSTFNFHFK